MRSFLLALPLFAAALSSYASPVTFSGATATFNQTSGFNLNASQMIDGISAGANGWAIARGVGQSDQTLSETALLTLSTPLTSGPRDLTITLYQQFGAFHDLGDFSLGYTTAASPTLADAQTAFTITKAVSQSGATFTSSAPGQLLVGGVLLGTDIYTLTVHENSLVPITGFFLNAINDPSNGLPTGGPGRQPSNGNFVVSEFTASTVAPVVSTPEPASMMLFGLAVGAAGLAAGRRRAA